MDDLMILSMWLSVGVYFYVVSTANNGGGAHINTRAGFRERYKSGLLNIRNLKGEWSAVDGADSYCEESDIFNLRNSCLKLVKNVSENKAIVIADDDMFAPPSVYVINPNTKEIISQLGEIKYAVQLNMLRRKYWLVNENLKRGIIPEGIKDKRFKKEDNE